MKTDAVAMMIFILSLTWGGLLFFLNLAYQKERRQKQKTRKTL